MKVQLRVPGYAKAGDIITASARGRTFKVRIPAQLRPGQFFVVRVPDGNGDKKEATGEKSYDVTFNLAPAMIVGSDEYFKEVKKCGDWCSVSRMCCPTVTFGGEKEEIGIWHECCCCPFCFNFTIGTKKNGGSKYEQLGQLSAASCTDQNCMAVCCPCCYSGPKVQAKFTDGSGASKFYLKANIQWCQYCCLCLNFCNPCFRCYRFCCLDQQYTRYVQNIYGPDVNDDTVKAKLIYTTRMILPCLPDETTQIKIEAEAGQQLTESDIKLLSIYPALVSGYTSAEFCCPIYMPGGMWTSMPIPSGIPQVNEANNIQGEHMNIAEALEKRKKQRMW